MVPTRASIPRIVLSDAELVSESQRILEQMMSHPKAIRITAFRGELTVSGPVLTREADALLRKLRMLPGVFRLNDRLKIQSPLGVERAFANQEYQVGFNERRFQPVLPVGLRVGLGIAGAMVGILGWKSRGAARWVLSAFGASAFFRAITNEDFVTVAGTFLTPTVHLRRSIVVDAPPEVVYQVISGFENYPRFMSFVKHVRVNDKGGLRWTMVAPGGMPFDWDATIHELQPNEAVSWRSVPESIVRFEGAMRLVPAESEGTRINVELIYSPPMGSLGYLAARMAGFDPAVRIDEDLCILKGLVEQNWVSSESEAGRSAGRRAG